MPATAGCGATSGYHWLRPVPGEPAGDVGSADRRLGAATSQACAGRHILAIQDTSEINFSTTKQHRRGLGEIGKGNTHGLLLHAMLGVDAETGGIVGLAAGRIWTREGRVQVVHGDRRLEDKESERWLSTAEAAKPVLASAAMVTEVSDRESDLYVKWARVPEPGFHILTRAMHDRAIKGGGTLSSASLTPADEAVVELRARPGRPARSARLVASYAQVEVLRPKKTLEEGLPEAVAVSLVQVAEIDAPPGVEPVFWQLLTTHPVEDAAMAWRVVGWYRQRWIIEQFFRTLKQQGLQLEDSQLESADRLLKLTAIAARAACTIMQLVQARDGTSGQDARIAFTPHEIETLCALVPTLEGKTPFRRTHTRRNRSHGPLGSSPNSADGMAIPNPPRQAPSPSDTASNTSKPSPTAGLYPMCESPSPTRGRG